ncbi:putative sulfate exporter family transporter [Arthrobacter sp. Sa2BUA2]|uniref:Sulfate exporter family transporter n=1 Tax=Arthrobacter pullicola TaxID=2762224 RepID=A0ABR8YHK6_9MICC|nr:putative sulfate exporter family transporter [Arthrobacter pullicola]MBD8043705.1 putative sulfate exporter family transporter [Arthrobacter pullicola]
MPSLSAARTLPGLAASAVAVLACLALHRLLPGFPVLTAAVVLGLLAGNLPGTAAQVTGAWKPGLALAAKKFLRLGIVLLGLKVSLVDIAGLGWLTVLLLAALVGFSFGMTYLVCRAFRLPGEEPVLIAAGFSICGVSAIGAVAAARQVRQAQTAVPVAVVTMFGTLAIGVLPLLSSLLGLAPEVFGFLAGAAVHDVGQVVATAQTAGTAALALAVVVKLVRVLMLAPVSALAGLHHRRRSGHEGKLPPLIPLFVAGFLAAVLLRTTGILPADVLGAAAAVQDLLFAAALFGLGASVNVRSLLRTGGPAVAASLVSWLIIVGAALLLALLLVPAG